MLMALRRRAHVFGLSLWILCVGHEWDIMLLELLSKRARSKKVVRVAIGKAAPVKF